MYKYQFALITRDNGVLASNHTYNSISDIDMVSSNYDYVSLCAEFVKAGVDNIQGIWIRFTIDKSPYSWYIEDIVYKDDNIAENNVRKMYGNYLTHNPQRLIDMICELELRNRDKKVTENEEGSVIGEQISFLALLQEKEGKRKRKTEARDNLKEVAIKALNDNTEIPKEHYPNIYVLTGLYLGTLDGNYMKYRRAYFEAKNNIKSKYISRRIKSNQGRHPLVMQDSFGRRR